MTVPEIDDIKGSLNWDGSCYVRFFGRYAVGIDPSRMIVVTPSFGGWRGTGNPVSELDPTGNTRKPGWTAGRSLAGPLEALSRIPTIRLMSICLLPNGRKATVKADRERLVLEDVARTCPDKPQGFRNVPLFVRLIGSQWINLFFVYLELGPFVHRVPRAFLSLIAPS
jgi:hypothetical protein